MTALPQNPLPPRPTDEEVEEAITVIQLRAAVLASNPYADVGFDSIESAFTHAKLLRTLLSALAHAREDSKRLDWLRDNPRPCEVHLHGKVEKGYAWAIASAFPEIRDAIDAARNAP